MASHENDWKIVVDESLEKPDRYDLAADRAQERDLVAREPARVAAMMERLRAHAVEIEVEGQDWWRTLPNGPAKKPVEQRK